MLNLSPTLISSSLQLKMKNIFHALQQGHPVILCDDEDREHEADLIIAAEKITEKMMALLIRECSGIVCLCLTDDKINQLKLKP